jgi:hypothetical protein
MRLAEGSYSVRKPPEKWRLFRLLDGVLRRASATGALDVESVHFGPIPAATRPETTRFDDQTDRDSAE